MAESLPLRATSGRRRRSPRLAAVALVMLLPLADPAAPTPRTFYVDVHGSDTSDGSASDPWRTLQRAADAVRAGDRVVVRPGTYAGFDLSTSGTAAAPILFQADPGTVVNAPSALTLDGINVEGASWVVIEGFTVTGVPGAGIRSVLNHHVTIRNNMTDLNGRWGIRTAFSDDLLIEGNVTSRAQAEHGISLGSSGDRPVVRGNVVWGNYMHGIHLHGDSSQGGDGIISNALVDGNVLHGNGRGGGSGIDAAGVQFSRIQNNLLYDNHAGGISLHRGDGGGPSSNNVVVHNTVVQAGDGRWAVTIKNASTGNTIVDNILWNEHSQRGSLSVALDSLDGFTSDWNVVMARFTLDGGENVLDLAGWRDMTGHDAHSKIAPPVELFVDPAAADYHLRRDSPARDAGLTLSDVREDLEGTPRPTGSAADIGAFEFASMVSGFTVSLSRTGNGGGSVESVPPGISCGAECARVFRPNAVVILTATAAAGSRFDGWSGGDCSGTGACTVRVGANTTVTATFTQVGPAVPDLVETMVSDPPARLRPRASFAITDTTRNQGTGRSVASTTAYYLSAEGVRSATDTRLSGFRSVPALAPGRSSTGSRTVRVPPSTPPGVYFLLACADDTEAAADGDRANNCAASRTTVTIVR